MKSVSRIRLVKTENLSACVTVNYKVCAYISDSTVIACSSELCVNKSNPKPASESLTTRTLDIDILQVTKECIFL
jgi:hypothetical protein